MTTEVTMHRIGYRGKHRPAVNVKVYDLGASVEDIMDEFGCRREVAEDALEAYYSAARDHFWQNTAPDRVSDAFGDEVEVWQEGRGGGWLVVEGLPESVESWDESDLEAWKRFREDIKSHIEEAKGPEAIMRWIEVNGYALEHIPIRIEVEECGCCGQYHPAGYGGDCRNDTYRFASPEEAERVYRNAPKLLEAVKGAKASLEKLSKDIHLSPHEKDVLLHLDITIDEATQPE